MSSLSNEQINALLASEVQQARTRRGPRVDITLDRTIQVWQKLNHHLCMVDCEHRSNPLNQSPSHRACWNPNCVDPRDADDRGILIVSEVAGQYMCRYCFLDRWLLPS